MSHQLRHFAQRISVESLHREDEALGAIRDIKRQSIIQKDMSERVHLNMFALKTLVQFIGRLKRTQQTIQANRHHLDMIIELASLPRSQQNHQSSQQLLLTLYTVHHD